MEYDYNKERQEAIDAGNKALSSLYAARKHLDSAKNWGIMDMIGGGLISTMIKRSKMDDAKSDMEQAKFDLMVFSNELRDVSSQFDLDIDTDDFLSFADFFFDNFFVDMMVQEKINNARYQVDDAIARVEHIMASL